MDPNEQTNLFFNDSYALICSKGPFILILLVILFHQINLFFCSFFPNFSYSRYVYLEHLIIRNIVFDMNITQILQPKELENCPNCSNTAPKSKNSSERDCIVSVSFQDVSNIFPFCRSLRSTGSKASVFLLFDDVAYHKLTKDTKQLLKNCSIYCYNVGYFAQPKIYDNVFAYKHLLVYN